MTENNIRVSLRIKFPKGTYVPTLHKINVKLNKWWGLIHQTNNTLITKYYTEVVFLFSLQRYTFNTYKGVSETAAQQGRKPHHKKLTGLNKMSHIQPSNQNI